jgi:hypothetical protein
LTRSGSPTPLHPNAKERRPRRQQWGHILEWLLGWTRTRRKWRRKQRKKKKLLREKESCAVANG